MMNTYTHAHTYTYTRTHSLRLYAKREREREDDGYIYSTVNALYLSGHMMSSIVVVAERRFEKSSLHYDYVLVFI